MHRHSILIRSHRLSVHFRTIFYPWLCKNFTFTHHIQIHNHTHTHGYTYIDLIESATIGKICLWSLFSFFRKQHIRCSMLYHMPVLRITIDLCKLEKVNVLREHMCSNQEKSLIYWLASLMYFITFPLFFEC